MVLEMAIPKCPVKTSLGHSHVGCDGRVEKGIFYGVVFDAESKPGTPIPHKPEERVTCAGKKPGSSLSVISTRNPGPLAPWNRNVVWVDSCCSHL